MGKVRNYYGVMQFDYSDEDLTVDDWKAHAKAWLSWRKCDEEYWVSERKRSRRCSRDGHKFFKASGLICPYCKGVGYGVRS